MPQPFALTLASLTALLLAAACSGAPAATSQPPVATPSAAAATLKLTPVAEAEYPWGLAFLPDGSLLFTEKFDGLKLVKPGSGASATPVAGLPAAYTEGQAGYLGLAIAPDFETSRLIYVALSAGTDRANSTIVVRGRLNEARTALENVEEIFRADPRDTAYHYGSRLAFAADGTLFVTLGDGFKYMNSAQDPATTHGKIVRINADGSIPADNPYADGMSGHPAVWSIGHRNVQGLAYDPASGRLWATEHGPKGGDELNSVQRGINYGWPRITYGVNYDGTIISRETAGEGLAQPEVFWVPSIAPSGLVQLTSDVYPGWQGDLFAGGMNGPAGLVLVRIDIENGRVVGKEDLLKGELSVRDVVQGPDGHLYLAGKGTEGIFRVDIGG